MTIYDFTVKNNKGEEISLDQYKGNVLLVVNTATKCGLTPQYDALEAVYQKYHDQGFEILDFPSNQFLEQAPGSDEEINSFCTLTYNTTFPRFAKINVNGDNADPLYVWLKNEIPQDTGNEETVAFEKKVEEFTPNNKPSDIKWNFGKFLIDRNGNVIGRFSPTYEPDKLSEQIETLLNQ